MNNLWLFLINNIVFGLLQTWVLATVLAFRRIQYKWWQLIKDGGLFIFASTVTINSFISHIKIINKVEVTEITWSFLFVFVIMMMCLIGFLTAVQTRESINEPFTVDTNPIHNWTQIMCSIFSIAYGLIITYRIDFYITDSFR